MSLHVKREQVCDGLEKLTQETYPKGDPTLLNNDLKLVQQTCTRVYVLTGIVRDRKNLRKSLNGPPGCYEESKERFKYRDS